ncbi:phosphate ABC transporter permease subunit PstC [Nostoc sp. FACHB-152]|uniref:phosphate ABC transporter permease subunit PstC n=1 Tax=unclassified Nostoc TaxID=2593658 RepID=UPI001684A216|nr:MULTISPECIES: phosphate ABC transporter permease subunit PstC [unclassified Nostoc]MBD2446254.1 phosphate ABC transporter permease subunit PstC [Nostoc sp. FACHB-152]MBD2469524.1 phosphate ABC transporter permease subunit PstC [Nostoc sp. FACHB-145]
MRSTNPQDDSYQIFRQSLDKNVSEDILERLIAVILFACALVSVLTTFAIVVIIFQEAFGFFQQVSLAQFFFDTKWTPLFADRHFGVWPLINGTVLTTAIAMAVAIPLGLSSAIYLSEYAQPKVAAILRPAVELLAGIPTVVYGYFALLFVTPLLRNVIPLELFNALSAGLMMGVMITPTVGSISLDAIQSVPRSLREGAYALGITKLEAIFKVVLPAALSGIIASIILGISRAVGETMTVVIAAGQQPKITINFAESVETMTAYMAQISGGDSPRGSLNFQTLYAVGALLFLITLALNIISYWIANRFKEKYD